MAHTSSTPGRGKPSKSVTDARAALSRRIIAERERLGVLQKHLAWRAGVAVETLSRIEQGRVSATADTIAKIDKAIAEYDQAARQTKG